MREYEYIIEAVEGYLCDQLTSVICFENYQIRSRAPGYLELFQQYWELHKEFKDRCEQVEDRTGDEEARREFRLLCQGRRADIQASFLKDLQAFIDDPAFQDDAMKWKDRYLERLENEDTQTVAKRICLYPYLLSALVKYKEGEGKSHGEKN